MTVLLRSFIVWLMLLALPYQGYASAQMMLCVAPAEVDVGMPAGPHDHAAMLAAQAQAHAQVQAQAGHHGDEASHTHTSMKCSGSACCAGAAPVLALAVVVPALPPAARAVAFYSAYLPAVDLAHPERPPQSLHV
ncbi:hypothetical protein [Duganella callida]|uniref:DUF2946 domain-containing protein n=1 Tax=Duganella callida TaxID=2561932 RepID=A0A4Y9S407_9BURK|nr:hypothetical protein [Duganella callida]TFW15901.1 hypothetical protein E4L98_24685 [Duganella callida]